MCQNTVLGGGENELLEREGEEDKLPVHFFLFFSREFYCVDVAVVLLLMRIRAVKINIKIQPRGSDKEALTCAVALKDYFIPSPDEETAILSRTGFKAPISLFFP